MLLPQSSAFATLRNRLNIIRPIGYLRLFPRYFPRFCSPLTLVPPNPPVLIPTVVSHVPNLKKSNGHPTDLLEKFRSVQLRHEKAPTRQLLLPRFPHIDTAPSTPAVGAAKRNVSDVREAAQTMAPTHKLKGSRSIQTITHSDYYAGDYECGEGWWWRRCEEGFGCAGEERIIGGHLQLFRENQMK